MLKLFSDTGADIRSLPHPTEPREGSTIKHTFTPNPRLHMRRLYRKRLITPTPQSLKQASTEVLIMMAANQSGLLSPGGLANIAAEIKSRNTAQKQA